MRKRSLVQGLDNLSEEHEKSFTKRRAFLRSAAFMVGGLSVVSPAFAGLTTKRERQVSFYNKHTGETVRAVYWVPDEGYVKQSLAEVSYILRDHRTDEVKPVDPQLLDQMYAMHLALSARQPIHVISGYRSPATNAMLRRRSRHVAKNSLHMQGRAVDIRVPGRRVADVYRAAVSLKAGGVGFYPRSEFVHIDTGRVRTWR